jgi:predicted metal-binding membrane protein
VPLAPTGVRATLACARFGWVHATACVGSCWAVMTVMAAAPSSHLLWGALLTPVVLHERTASQPGRAARQSAAALLATAALLLLLTASRIW